MPSFLERLRAALADRYDVDHEIASGGMGTVWLGHDRHLDHVVAIKTLRDDLTFSYDAVMEERFLREARTLRKVSHPNIVTVHDVDKRGGIPFYVMEYLTGETLTRRLARGPLPLEAVRRLARDVLDALGTAHAKDVIHRDVKPDNIIFQDGRAVLTDFGIAKVVRKDATQDTLTVPGVAIGTRGYMAPEQAEGRSDITPRADLYAVGAVLYEALTGQTWEDATSQGPTWRHVAGAYRRVLQRALRHNPSRRWKSAAAFARALDRAQRPSMIRVLIAAGAAVVLVAAGALYVILHSPPPYDVVVAPFVTDPPSLGVGTDVARLAATNLRYFSFATQDPVASFSCWDRAGGPAAGASARQACGKVGRFIIEGTATVRGDSAAIAVSVLNRRQAILATALVTGPADSLFVLTTGVTNAVLKVVDPRDTQIVEFCGRQTRALAAFVQGEEAFGRDEWLPADQYYQQALALDSTCALAQWRLTVVRAWRQAPLGVDLQALYARRRLLPRVVQELVWAELAPTVPERLARFDSAVTHFPNDGYGWLLYGNELWSRGALAGRDLDDAADALREAARLDPSAPAYDHVAWLEIRRGNCDSARAALVNVSHRASPEGDVNLPGLLQLGYHWRCEDATVDPHTPVPPLADLAKAVRFGLTVDVPMGQAFFGQRLSAKGSEAALAANGHRAQGVAFVMMGRDRDALAQFDSAGRVARDTASRVEPAEWRVLLPALGLPALDSAATAQGRASLERLTRDPVLGGRAAWDLAVAAYAAGDSAAAERWSLVQSARRTTSEDSSAADALAALRAGSLGHAAEAARAARAPGELPANRLQRYPFLRAVMHVRQGDWRRELGQRAQAESAWVWYDNADVAGWPDGALQAGDVDWALASWGRLLRARLDSNARACDAKRVADLWAGADSAYAPLRAEARRLSARCRS